MSDTVEDLDEKIRRIVREEVDRLHRCVSYAAKGEARYRCDRATHADDIHHAEIDGNSWSWWRDGAVLG